MGYLDEQSWSRSPEESYKSSNSRMAQDNRSWRLNFQAESAELDKVPAFTPVINLLKVKLLRRGFLKSKSRIQTRREPRCSEIVPKRSSGVKVQEFSRKSQVAEW